MKTTYLDEYMTQFLFISCRL